MQSQLFKASLASSTWAAYVKILQSYVQFVRLTLGSTTSFPSTVAMVAHYIASLFEKGYSPSTIATHISAIAFIHKLISAPDPTASFYVRKLLKGAQNLKTVADKRLPITRTILSKLILALCHTVSSEYNRRLCQAMFILAFHAFLRMGEIACRSSAQRSIVIQLSDVSFIPNNACAVPSKMQIVLRHYKHKSSTDPITLCLNASPDISTCPVRYMKQYMQLISHTDGPLFQFRDKTPVTTSYTSKVLHDAVSFIGCDTALYKGHSFRIGAATSAAAAEFRN